ncbi:MAG TPA: tyrosine-protein phosphatase [Steroidobacteraceae bacterium]|nr:tyrosine-protein phosphatase [Steroidobacteraceae bacterium]
MGHRALQFSAIHNFRDYGGYRAGDGNGRLRRGLLYRSAQHADATPEDLNKVVALGLVSVIDLRGPSERASSPCRRAPGFAARIFLLEEETGSLMPRQAGTVTLAGSRDIAKLMLDGYAAMPFRRRMKNVIAHYFNGLVASDGPTLVHCMAGKDRTGFAVGLLHSALGVHQDDVLSDYMLSNEGVDGRIAATAPLVRATYGKSLSDEEVLILMTVRSEYLEASMRAVRERHGTVSAYLETEIGVPRARLETLAERLMV